MRPWSATELQEIVEAERAGGPFVLWRDGAGRLLLRGLDDNLQLTIGRRGSSDIALADDVEVSRLHALLERLGDDWTLVDGGLSRNGTFLNGQPLRFRRRLADGDQLRVGSTVLEYRDPAHAAQPATATGREVAEVEALSSTQRRILEALCRPHCDGSELSRPATNAEIAGAVFLGVDAVKAHLRVLYGRFGLADLPQNQKRAQLAIAALRSGVVPKRGATGS